MCVCVCVCVCVDVCGLGLWDRIYSLYSIKIMSMESPHKTWKRVLASVLA